MLNDQLQKHEAEIETQKRELGHENYRSILEAHEEKQEMAYELVDLQNMLDDEKEKYSQLLQASEHTKASHQDELRSKDQKIDLLYNDLQENKDYTLQREEFFQNNV